MGVELEENKYQNLLNASLRLVSFRPRSEKEIREFLLKKIQKLQISPQEYQKILARVLSRLRELGYADDKKFIQWWIEQRALYRPKGRRALLWELRQKGIDESLAHEVLEESRQYLSDSLKDDALWEKEEAVKAIRLRLERWKHLPPIVQKRKMYSFLERRGFSPETIYHVIDEVVKKDYNTT